MSSHLNELRTLRDYVVTVTRKAGMRVVFDPTAKTAATNEEGLIIIPAFNSHMTEEDVAKIRHFALHETLHHTEGEDGFKIIKKNKLVPDSPLFALLNILEDERIERAGAKHYRGDKQILSEGRDVLLQEWLHEMRTEGDYSKHPQAKDIDLTVASQILTQYAGSDWNTGSQIHSDKMYQSSPPTARALADKFEKQGLVEEVRALKNPADSWAMAQRLYEESGGDVQQELQRCEAKTKEMEGKGGEPDADMKKKMSELGRYMLSEHGGNKRDKPLTYVDQPDGRNDAAPLPYERFQITDLKNTPPRNGGSYKSWLRQFAKDTNERASALSNTVKKLLTIKAQSFYTGGHKAGRVHNKNMYRVGVPLIGDGDWNSKVFKKKHVSDILNSAVTIAVDVSGSMSGERLAHAGAACTILHETLCSTLRVPVEIIAYSSQGGGEPALYIIKDFESRVSETDLTDRFDHVSNFMRDNPDGDCLLYISDRLSVRPEKKKVMIVLTDGQPTRAFNNMGQAGSNPERWLSTAVKDIESRPNHKVYAIGIQYMGVKQTFKNHAIVNQTDELEETILKLIENEFIKE